MTELTPGQRAALPFTTALVVAFLGGLWTMLLLGILHLNVSTTVPALGYWTCVPLILLGRMVLAMLVQRVSPLKVDVSATQVAKAAAKGDRELARR